MPHLGLVAEASRSGSRQKAYRLGGSSLWASFNYWVGGTQMAMCLHLLTHMVQDGHSCLAQEMLFFWVLHHQNKA